MKKIKNRKFLNTQLFVSDKLKSTNKLQAARKLMLRIIPRKACFTKYSKYSLMSAQVCKINF